VLEAPAELLLEPQPQHHHLISYTGVEDPAELLLEPQPQHHHLISYTGVGHRNPHETGVAYLL
jgi:hypothetical protein